VIVDKALLHFTNMMMMMMIINIIIIVINISINIAQILLEHYEAVVWAT